jgi:hypothetical protein
MLVQGNRDNLGSCVVNKDRALLIVGVLQQLLAEIISKRIYNNCQQDGTTEVARPLQLTSH